MCSLSHFSLTRYFLFHLQTVRINNANAMMDTLIYISVVILTTSVSLMTSCPEVFRCIGWEVDCIYGNLVAVPNDLRVTGGVVDFSFNILTYINKSALENITRVNTIKLYRNNLIYIEAMTFSHLDSLKELDLGNNNLTTLPSDVFSDLTGLETLYMDANLFSFFSFLYHTHSNIWYTCNKTDNTKNTIRILK